ncbi:MAG: hypothetical protein HY905_07465 [Deltaproteobacteria bacterium]|nr:hypothetical protein [Deltaproteobacteria bacterium]
MTDSPQRRGLSAADQWIERLLESSATKALVVAFITCSLLPQLDRPLLHFFVFLPLFGAEFALRLRLFVAHRVSLRRRRLAGDVTAPGERRRLEPLLLALDMIAVLSFLPIGHLLDNARLLRLARLVRLVIVVRYAADLLRDFWLVVTRRERLGQLLVLLLTVATLSFVAAALLVFAEPGNPLHGGNLFDAFWWAFLQLESADNIVRTLHQHPALVVASVLLTITGIFLMSFVIGLGTNIVAALVVATRHRAVDLEGHTVVGAPPQAARRILRDLGRLRSRNVPERRTPDRFRFLSPIRRLRRYLGARRILLAGPDDEPPAFLLDHEFRGMLYRTTALSDPRACELVGAQGARCIVLVPDECDPAADDRCLSSALCVGEALARAAASDADDRNPAPRDLFLQVRDEVNVPAALLIRRRLHDAGVGCQVLDMERLVGLFLAQHVIDPDLDPVFEQILAVRGQAIWVRMSGEDDREGDTWPRPLPDVVPHEHSWRRYGVIPLGLLTVPQDGGAPPRGASALRRTHDCSTSLGLGPRTERPDPGRIAGVVALAMSEHNARSWAHALADGRLDGQEEPPPAPAAVALAASLSLASHEARRILLVGDHPALGALIVELIRFLPGLEIRLRPERAPENGERLAAALEASLRRVDPAAALQADGDGFAVRLADGRSGRFGLHPARAGASAVDDLVGAGDLEEFDRVVFLSDPAVPGSDDRTTVRLLRVTDAARCRRGCRLVVQVESESRADLLTAAARADGDGGPRPLLSVLAAEQVRAHFLAHAMLTPGIVPVLDELLAERGQEFVRLDPRPGVPVPHERIPFGDLLVALGRRGPGVLTAIGWALDREGSRETVLNPGPDDRPFADEIRSVFAVGDTRVLSGRSGSSPTASGA